MGDFELLVHLVLFKTMFPFSLFWKPVFPNRSDYLAMNRLNFPCMILLKITMNIMCSGTCLVKKYWYVWVGWHEGFKSLMNCNLQNFKFFSLGKVSDSWSLIWILNFAFQYIDMFFKMHVGSVAATLDVCI